MQIPTGPFFKGCFLPLDAFHRRPCLVCARHKNNWSPVSAGAVERYTWGKNIQFPLCCCCVAGLGQPGKAACTHQSKRVIQKTRVPTLGVFCCFLGNIRMVSLGSSSELGRTNPLDLKHPFFPAHRWQTTTNTHFDEHVSHVHAMT